ncbi:MAG: SH3 domain-containing protein [Bdellovibrionota bacterium]
MKPYLVKSDYVVAYPNPIILKTGDAVTIEKWETNPEWLGWAFCVGAKGIKGWVSEKYLRVNGTEAIVVADYNATELGVSAGELVTSHKEEFGWAWVENSIGKQGWVPLQTLVTS